MLRAVLVLLNGFIVEYKWDMIHVWHSIVNVVLDFILSELFEKSEVSEVKPNPPLYAQRFVILQPNCQPADLMVFKFNCNTFNSILYSVTPDQIDILVSDSSLARCISYDGFFKWWIWFHYVTIWNTWGTTMWDFSHPDLFFPSQNGCLCSVWGSRSWTFSHIAEPEPIF